MAGPVGFTGEVVPGRDITVLRFRAEGRGEESGDHCGCPGQHTAIPLFLIWLHQRHGNDRAPMIACDMTQPRAPRHKENAHPRIYH